MTKLLHIAENKRADRVWHDVFIDALQKIGELEIIENANSLSEDEKSAKLRECTIYLTCWGSSPVPLSIIKDRGQLRYICNITGSLRRMIPLEIIEAGIPVTNWGDAPAKSVAESAMMLLLATLKDMHHKINLIENDEWHFDYHQHGGSIDGLHIGMYGFGVIGREFLDLIRPFNPIIRVFDPFVSDFPNDLTPVDSLKELFKTSQAILIFAGMTADTWHTVTAELLSLLPKYAVIINTARGAIIDQDALFRELETGRLRAGLDVLDPDRLPNGHPARKWENLILSSHQGSLGWPDDYQQPSSLNIYQKICIENIKRSLNGEPLNYIMDDVRYHRST